MLISSNHDFLIQNNTSSHEEAQGMHSLPSSAAVALFPKEHLSHPARPHALQRNPFPVGGRELGSAEYNREKSQVVHSSTAARGEDILQADVQTFKAAAIFSALHLPADFPGPEESSWGPLECSLAAGPSHLIAVTTSSWAVLNKAGESLFQCDWSDWFEPVTPEGTELKIFNPKALYDQHSGKWFLVASAWQETREREGLPSYFLIAVSQTHNPMGNWWGWRISANLNGQHQTPFHATSLGLGIDHAALYLSANMFDASGVFRYAKLRVLDKSQLLRGSELRWYDFWDLRNADHSAVFGLRPSHTFGSPGVEYLLNATPEGKEITLWSLKLPLSEKPQLQRRSIPTKEYHLAPNAFQPPDGHEIDTGDTRFVNAVFRNGALWAAHTIAANWEEPQNRAAIQWFQLNPGAGKIVKQHVYGAPGYDYFCPTLMADGRGNVILVFNRSGEQEYPAIRFTGRLGIDTSNRLQASSLLKDGQVPGPSAWGAYNGAAVDPNDIKVWIIGKYPTQESVGATWIGETSYMRDQPEMRRKAQG